MQSESKTDVIERPSATSSAIVAFDPRREVQIQTLQSFREMAGFFREIAETAFEAGMVPAGIKNVQGALTAIWRGCEVGLLPQQALQSVYIVNGIPQLYGDAPVGIVEASGLLEDRTETEEGTFPEDNYTWLVTVKRRGHSKPRVSRFTIGDAKTAKLWGKMSKDGVPSSWVLYPKRMLLWRARGYALRDEFPDVLKGFPIRELLDDDDALFQAARPVTAQVIEPNLPSAVGQVTDPNFPSSSGIKESVKRGRGRPPRSAAPSAEPPSAEPEPIQDPGHPMETPEKAPEPETKPEPPPKATETNHEPTHGVQGRAESVFDFKTKAAEPEPPKRPNVREQVASKLLEAKIPQKDFIYLLAFAGLLDDEIGEANIETGSVNLANVPESACQEALNDWPNALKALREKSWTR